jgi:hypothetical protein
MKSKKFQKSLVLNKNTIADLNGGAMNLVLGGGYSDNPPVCETKFGPTCNTRCGSNCWC